jgi:hypothetical protein
MERKLTRPQSHACIFLEWVVITQLMGRGHTAYGWWSHSLWVVVTQLMGRGHTAKRPRMYLLTTLRAWHPSSLLHIHTTPPTGMLCGPSQPHILPCHARQDPNGLQVDSGGVSKGGWKVERPLMLIFLSWCLVVVIT